MKVIILYNKGELDPLALQLMGASTKRGDSDKIGMFGSGFKYALSWIARELNMVPRVFSGDREIDIRLEAVSMRGQSYERFVIDNNATSITTSMGPRWEKWMALRELYANAVDEQGGMAVEEEDSLAMIEYVKPGTTTIVLSYEPFEEVMSSQDFYFARNRPVAFENKVIRIYERSISMGFYCKGIYVGSVAGARRNGLGYELISPYQYIINEERQVKDAQDAASMTVSALMSVNEPGMVHELANEIRRGDDLFQLIQLFRPWATCGVRCERVSDAWRSYVFCPINLEHVIVNANGQLPDNHLMVPQDFYEWLKERGAVTFDTQKLSVLGGYEKRIEKIRALAKEHAPIGSNIGQLVVSTCERIMTENNALHIPVLEFSGMTNQHIAAQLIVSSSALTAQDIIVRLMNNDIKIP